MVELISICLCLTRTPSLLMKVWALIMRPTPPRDFNCLRQAVKLKQLYPLSANGGNYETNTTDATTVRDRWTVVKLKQLAPLSAN